MLNAHEKNHQRLLSRLLPADGTWLRLDTSSDFGTARRQLAMTLAEQLR
jgi:hypothetical protein